MIHLDGISIGGSKGLKSWEATAGGAENCLYAKNIQPNPIQPKRCEHKVSPKKVKIYLKDPLPRWDQQSLTPERQELVLPRFSSLLEISNPRDVVAKHYKVQGFASFWKIHPDGISRCCWYPPQCHLLFSGNVGNIQSKTLHCANICLLFKDFPRVASTYLASLNPEVLLCSMPSSLILTTLKISNIQSKRYHHKALLFKDPPGYEWHCHMRWA